jgi:hypothetical protein
MSSKCLRNPSTVRSPTNANLDVLDVHDVVAEPTRWSAKQ